MKILLADDHGLVRDALGRALKESRLQADVVKAEDLEEALARVADSGPFELVLLDYMMPGMNGVSGLERMVNAVQCGVVLISGVGSQEVARNAERVGAVGFLPKTMGVDAMIDAVRRIYAGGMYFPTPAPDAAAEAANLTRREREVLSYLYQGLQNKEIARELGLQEVTIKLHVRSLCKKLNVANRTQAAMRGQELGLAPVT